MPDLTIGLSTSDVPRRRASHGSNILTPPPRTPGWKLYLEKFEDPVIRILLIAAAIAIAVGVIDGRVAEGIGILVAIFLATFLAYWNESRAAKAFDILNLTSDDIPVKVIRDGGYQVVPKRDIVVDDVVFIEVGEELPADGKIVEAVGLLVNESRLTGEAVPVERGAGELLFRGTTIVDGYATLTVTAVGDRTELGRTLVESIEDTDDITPLNQQLSQLSRVIGVVGFGVAVVVFLALFIRGLLVHAIQLSSPEWLFISVLSGGLMISLVNLWFPIFLDALRFVGLNAKTPEISWLKSMALGVGFFAAAMAVSVLVGAVPASPSEWLNLTDGQLLLRNFMIAVTIIVVAVPEGLAMSVTLSLAYSMRKMTADQTLVRRMAACETIGAATVICSDKTGTLTENQMRFAEAVIGGSPTTTLPLSPALRPLIVEALAVNSTAHLTFENGVATPVGNPTEGALLLWLHSQGVDYQAVRYSSPIHTQWNFNTQRKMMATRGRVLHVKGAPELILGLCDRLSTDAGSIPFDEKDRQAIIQKLTAYQSRGMRLIAFAIGEPDAINFDCEALTGPPNLTFLLLVAINDPVRENVPLALADCLRAGIAVKVVTGDDITTASEIARQIGLKNPDALTGPTFAALSDEDAKSRVKTLNVLARARPADKLRLVRMLKEQGEVVAVTGDGVNDGPALNHADVGLAMGKTGTAVAREASDIILLDDSFPSIVNAVRWGRALYENIQRFILFQLTINVVALGLAVAGPFLGYEMPLTVMQMLWVNLIMDTFAALALATEPPHDRLLHRPPRPPGQFIVTGPMAKLIFGGGAVFLAILMGMIVWLDPTDGATREGTILFTVFVLLQFWNLLNAKGFGQQGSVLPKLTQNPMFLIIMLAILIGQILLVQCGGAVFRTVPLSALDWLIIFSSTSIVFWFGEFVRIVTRTR